MAMSAKDRFRGAIGTTGRALSQEEEAFQQLDEFDPTAAVEKTADAGFSRFREDLAREIEALRGQSVGMGRLDTGFEWEDEGDVVRTLGDRLNREIAGSAMQAASLDASNRANVASVANARADRHTDLLAADRDFETAEANARRERKGRLAAGIGSLLGAGGGFLLGGPAGAKTGATIGGYAGGLFG